MTDPSKFERRLLTSKEEVTRIGSGYVGGKAAGLLSILEVLHAELSGDKSFGITVSVPHMTVITTEIFDAFIEENRLDEIDFASMSDDRIAHRFLHSSLPPEVVGDLRALSEEVHVPLAIRSSSLLEDAMYQPFAGVYATKMIPNNQPSPDIRFQKLTEAIKYVFASTFFRSARYYRESIGKQVADEKMAVIVQEIVGQRHGPRFYPTLSGVARSYNFYPHGRAVPEAGVVELALGLGKTIVDGGKTWSYSPSCPKAPPPFNDVSDMMKNTQTELFAVNMGAPPAHDPVRETEYLVKIGLEDAEKDGALEHVASTYVPGADRVVPGTGQKGPRIVSFAPLLVLNQMPLSKLIDKVMRICEDATGEKVEIELAMNIHKERGRPPYMGFLQVRPMVISGGVVEVPLERLSKSDVLISSENVLGNGVKSNIEDIVYIRPDTFEPAHSLDAVGEIEEINRKLTAENRPYLFIGFGRIGTSDPWRGIPATWSQLLGARVMVEVQREGMETELSQGSHFFHNLTSGKVFYFSIPLRSSLGVDWDFIESREEVETLSYVRHVRTSPPLVVMVDGRTRRGAVFCDEPAT